MNAFTKWLQERLNVHGTTPRLKEDGDLGPATRGAMDAFQRRKKLIPSGVADDATIHALRRVPQKRAATVPVVAETMPPWAAELHRRLNWHEASQTSALIRWFKSQGKYLGNPKQLPWCGEGVENAILKCLPHEKVPANPFWARAWESDFGTECDYVPGAIGVIGWNSGGGHVGVIAKVERDNRGNTTHVTLLGCNQGNAINYRRFAFKMRKGKFIGARWPKTYAYRAYRPFGPNTALGGGDKGDTR